MTKNFIYFIALFYFFTLFIGKTRLHTLFPTRSSSNAEFVLLVLKNTYNTRYKMLTHIYIVNIKDHIYKSSKIHRLRYNTLNIYSQTYSKHDTSCTQKQTRVLITRSVTRTYPIEISDSHV